MKRQRADAPHSALPSREDLLAFIAREREANGGSGKIGKREIARAFGVKGDDRVELKRLIAALEAEGALERRGKRLTRPGVLPAVVLADITGRDPDGELIAVPAEWNADEFGAAPRILVKAPRRPKPGEPLPGVGDRALIRAEPDRDAGPNEPPYAGRIVKLLSTARGRIIGVLRVAENGVARIEPVDKKQAGRELSIAAEDRGEAEDGDLVAVDLIGKTRFGAPRARVRETLGSLTTEKAISMIALKVHGIPDVFRAEALAEAAEATPAALEAHREDWRALPLVTIDPPDAKDHDDAVFAEPDTAADNPNGHIVTVAIADVAYYVRPHSALDKDALERGNSVYFPDRVVPMLPERISNDLCSLRPHEDRPALAVRMRITDKGHKLDHSFHRIMMRSKAKLNYAQAQEALDGRPDETCAPLMESVLAPLHRAYQAADQARELRAPLDLDLPERKILLKPDGTVDRVVVPPRLSTHRLIEEFMILANVSAAEVLEENRQKLIYRAHDEPSREKVTALSEFLATIGVKLAKGQVLRPSHFNVILARVRGQEHENIVNEIILRTQAQAEYTHENYGHFGLNLRRYAHFTSPIRRYADLVVHRALVRALKFGPGAMPDVAAGELAEIAARISGAERRAMAAERETVDRLIAAHLAEQIGARFAARISGVTKAGLFVRLLDTGADGFVPAATLGREYFYYDEAAHALTARGSGESYRLGDHIEVRLVEATPIAGALRFEIAGGGRTAPPQRRRSAAKGGRPSRRG
ncbi:MULTISPECIES: ribonuclease R [Methylosinus]|uniref:Ribonuclease R n=1 Tax=Methylosinus trichosporium (strain ATCC 35070 / NCIMB 11131 / UNIQEM 75 / OB3b) TaxID=595536 RepID=A0A2D2CVZ7_METT3|nr:MULTISPECIES: ribonuclease R [Methylosinus]ATQ66854.1 ribonuclease R [Methylosinus trichosporium OB3b]OBS54275.1 ribonuclease R [Methylosinus sp. 3S-1]